MTQKMERVHMPNGFEQLVGRGRAREEERITVASVGNITPEMARKRKARGQQSPEAR